MRWPCSDRSRTARSRSWHGETEQATHRRKNSTAIWKHDIRGPSMIRRVQTHEIAPPPRWIEPQLCKLVEKAPTGAQWVHEIKFDGYRMAARIDRARFICSLGPGWIGPQKTRRLRRLWPNTPLSRISVIRSRAGASAFLASS